MEYLEMGQTERSIMRWKKRNRPQPKTGDTRRVRRFLFLPLCLQGEWRWLEIAWIVERWVEWDMVGGRRTPLVQAWVPMRWSQWSPHVEPEKPWPKPPPQDVRRNEWFELTCMKCGDTQWVRIVGGKLEILLNALPQTKGA
jgi:hypothetical protein